MTVGSIAVTPSIDLTAKKLDTTVVTTTEGLVHREVALIGDPVDPAALVAVMATAPVGTEYGSVVRLAGTVPLPTGSATAALQTSGNASLTSLDGKTPALGQALAAASSPVVLTAAQITTLTPPAAIVGFALEAGHLATIDTSTAKIPSQGQALAAASMPVVLTAIQVAAITPPAAITGFALEAGHLATIDSHIPALGQALAAASVPVVLTAAQLTTLTPLATVAVTNAGLTNLDVALSTRLKPADTLAGVTTVTAVTAITNALPAGTNRIGSVRPVDSADADLTAAKGTQTTRFLGVQRSMDAGRNARIFMLDAFVAAPLAEAVQTVVQWYGNAAVAGTAQPAVVPAGKTLRLISWKIMYQSLATAGAAVVRVRVNTGGLGVLASPLVFSFEAGSAAAVAGVMTTETGDFPEGLEIPAGSGLAFSMAGYGPTGTLTLEGTTRFMVAGYEY